MTDITFLPPNEIWKIQQSKFVEMMSLVSQYHSAYIQKYANSQIDLKDADLSMLDNFPNTEKSDLAANFENYKLNLPVDYGEPIWDIAYTSGSTSLPIPIYQTSRDFRGILLAQRRMAEIRGLTSSDRILNLFPLTQYPHGAWTRANHAGATVGSYVACGMSGTLDEEFGATRSLSEIVKMIENLQPTVFWGVPTYIKKVLDALILGGVRVPSLRMIAVSGEVCTSDMKSGLIDYSKLIGAEVHVSNSLGASELQCGLVECADGFGFHNPAPELFYFSTLDESGKQVADGDFGSLAVTHLDRRGTFLIKYLLGDEVQLTQDKCSNCGRAGGRIIAHKGRAGTLLKIRGQLIDRNALERIVRDFEGVSDYMIRVRKQVSSDALSEDVLDIQIARNSHENFKQFELDLVAEVKQKVNLTPKIQDVSLGELKIENISIKTTRFKDER
jgi:phenylacetate-coenzyme A ligase PaaK-like adenylate-forming protein